MPPLEGAEEGRRRLFPKVVGINRGILDTEVNLDTGQVRTAPEIEGVEEGKNVKPVILEFSPFVGEVQRIHWGVYDRLVYPDGTVETVKAGTSLGEANGVRNAQMRQAPKPQKKISRNRKL